MAKKIKRQLAWTLAAIVTVPIGLFALAVAWLALTPAHDDYVHRTRFEFSAWLAQSRDQTSLWPTQLRMVDDLVGTKRLDGLERGEVMSLLGPGDQTDKWKDWDLVYWLGPERGFIRIDPEWLVVRFDRTGRVAAYRVVRD